jgi:hypothetical protein
MTVTKMTFEITSGTSTLQEINYWLSYERSLHIIDQQIQSDEVLIIYNRYKLLYKC